ncbi:MAG: hypothetical protein LW875_03510 [Proteobacteria bacterium]|jgi:hypothetical protein|nr:hypothetical protein [Pseudomonadota bacterium]
MSEVGFVIKSLALSIVLTVLLQFKLGNQTLEVHAYQWVRESRLGPSLQDVAKGAVLLMKDAKIAASDFVSQNFKSDSSEAKASRLTFELKRSEAGEKSQQK